MAWWFFIAVSSKWSFAGSKIEFRVYQWYYYILFCKIYLRCTKRWPIRLANSPCSLYCFAHSTQNRILSSKILVFSQRLWPSNSGPSFILPDLKKRCHAFPSIPNSIRIELPIARYNPYQVHFSLTWEWPRCLASVSIAGIDQGTWAYKELDPLTAWNSKLPIERRLQEV